MLTLRNTIALFLTFQSIVQFTIGQEINNEINSTRNKLKQIELQKDSLNSILEKLELLNDKQEIKNILLPELKPGEDLIEHSALFLVYDEQHEQSKWVAHKISQILSY